MPCARCEEPRMPYPDGTFSIHCAAHHADHAAHVIKSRENAGPSLHRGYAKTTIEDLIQELQREDFDLG